MCFPRCTYQRKLSTSLGCMGKIHAYERMNRVYNYSLDPYAPVYITIGDGGNIEGIDVDHADDPGKCPSESDNQPEFGGVCHLKFHSGPAQGRFCWSRQPNWSAYRESSFGYGILELNPCCCNPLDVNTEVRMMLDPAREAEELEVEMGSLRRSKEAVEEQIRELEGLPGKEVTADVRKWMKEVVQVDRQVSELLNSLRSYTRCFRLLCCCCYLRNYQLADKTRRNKTVVKVLQDEYRNRGGNIAITRPPERVVNLPGSLPKFLVGVDENVSRVFEQLKDPQVDVIGICGMGGWGKSTLVKEIVERLGLPEPAVHFDLVIPVVVSQSPDTFKIQEDIGVRLGYSRAKDRNDHPGKPSLPSDVSDRANTLSSLLSKKKFLLILDDVWEELDLGIIGVPWQRNTNHSKVLLTTRKSDVCGKMGKKLDVGLLSEADSMELFRWKIGMSLQRDEKEKEQIAVEIVRKCGGLPLSIVTIASALKIRSDIETWRSVKDKLDRCLSSLVPNMEEAVLKRLKISFDLLPRDEHRSGLLFCALYPEDWNIPISELVSYWIGEGLLEYSGLTEWEDLNVFGRDIVSTLEEACLLERGDDDHSVKLHDAVRDMAIWLGRGGDGYHQHNFLSQTVGKEDRILFVDEKWRDLQRVLFYGIEIDQQVKLVVPSGDTPPFIGLQTLLLPRCYNLECSAKDLFMLTPNLRVLDMRFLRLSHIPESIGCLHSLQYLALSGTRISNIPKELGKLINLVVLLLKDNWGITSIPRCAISPLVKLQILELVGTQFFFLESKQGDEEQLGLKDLCNLPLLTRLSLSLKGNLDVQGLLPIAKAIREIDIHEVSMDELSIILSRLVGIEVLQILSYQGLENRLELPQGCLPKCAKLLLYGLPFLTVKGQLDSLQVLRVWECNGLKELPSLAHFPNLETLYIDECTELVQVVSGEESAAVSNSWDDHDTNMHLSLPKLEYICLRDMPKLASISSVPLHVPSLQIIHIEKCPRLETALPMIIPCKLGYGDCDGGGKWDSEQGCRLWRRGNNVCEH